MKSRIDKIDKYTNDYPKLMYYVDDPSFIVLFTEEKRGTVVTEDAKGTWEIGSCYGDWQREDYWADFDGEVVLSNE